jgi:2-alkyl-3-oxoalkanoate reductase
MQASAVHSFFAGKTVLVTGATGFVGGTLALRLAEVGAQVKALARSPEKATRIRDVPNITVVQGDVTDAERMTAVIQGSQVVFHVAAAFADAAVQQQVNVEGTRHIAQAAAQAQVDRLVHVSSIAVYGYARAGRITEDQPPTPTANEPYSVTKAEAENVVAVAATAADLSYAIVRPGMIYGPHSGQWTDTMFRVARRRPIIWVGDGSGSTFPIHIDDLVTLMLIMAKQPAAHNQIFNAVNAQPATWREFLLGYAQLAGHQSWLGIPQALAVGLAQVMTLFGSLDSRLQAAPDYVRSLNRQATIDVSKARALLGWQPQISLAEGIAGCAPYLRQKGLLR